MMHHHCWIEIQTCIKMNDNTFEIARGKEGHDPCAKFRLVWDVLVHNMNCFILEGASNLTIDKHTWASMSYGGLALNCIMNKPNVTKGDQMVLLISAKRRYIHAWYPRHSLNPKPHPFTQQGPAEVYHLLQMLNKMVVGVDSDDDTDSENFFRSPPHLTFDNHFSGNHVMNYIGCLGYAAT